MANPKKPRVIAIEEHYSNPDLRATFPANETEPSSLIGERLADLTNVRLKEMDEAGIDLQVLSHVSPSAQKLDPESGAALARRVNDALNETVRSHPDRFAGFAALPSANPKAAADELERTVTKLGFKGAMIHGLSRGNLFLDDKQFWPIFERAQALDVPIYMHPAVPHPAVIEAYYKEYPAMIRAGWGFGVETATQGLRLIMSGLFDAYPKLKIILGHLGEGLPFSLWRCDFMLTKLGKLKRPLREVFCENFWITTSGNFSFPALQCCMLELGVDRIMFSVDWPFIDNRQAVEFMANIPVTREDKEKMLHGTAERLLKL